MEVCFRPWGDNVINIVLIVKICKILWGNVTVNYSSWAHHLQLVLMAKGKILDFQLHLKTDESFQQVLTDEENLWGELVVGQTYYNDSI